MASTKSPPNARTGAKKPAARGANRYRDSEIKKIQIAKRWALDNLPGFDDDMYRDLLQEAGGKRSCTELAWPARMAVLKRFEELGWKPLPAKGARPAPNVPSRRQADDDQSRMIRGLWIDLHTLGEVRDSSEKALNNFVLRMTRVAALQWVTDYQRSTVIEALKDMRARRTLALMNTWMKDQHGTSIPADLVPELMRTLRHLRIGEAPGDRAMNSLGVAAMQLLTGYKLWEAAQYGPA
jgi:phage gp16-like protein